jgi:hypothetical protein
MQENFEPISDPSRSAKELFPYIAYVLSCVILIIPIWMVTSAPLQDYPAHMARMHIMMVSGSDSILNQIYNVEWELIPNLAMDLMVPVMARGMPLLFAGNVFISVIVIMWVVGPLALHHALFGRVSYWPLIASFFAYNQCLLFGFLNFNFASGLLFFVLAAWIWCQDKSTAFRVALFSILATILFFCHFIAFAIYGMAVASYEAARLHEDGGFRRLRLLLKGLCIVSAQFVVPAVIFLFFSPTSHELVPTAGFYWGDIESRLAAVRSIIWFENGVFDYLAFAFTVGVFLYALLRGSLGFNRPFLASLAVLTVAALLTPQGLDGPGLRHIRIPPVLAALFFAGTRWKGERASSIGPVIVALGLAVFLSRTVSTAIRWQVLDGQIAEFRAATAKVREGASLFLVTAGPTGHAFLHAGGAALLHMADYATIDRSAFVPTVFADPGVQPIRMVEKYRENYRRAQPKEARWELLPALALEEATSPPTLAGWQKKYDYVVVVNIWGLDLQSTDCLVRLHSGSFFTIFEVRRSMDAETCWS